MEERVFERKIYSEMLEWKKQNDGRSAIMVEGARRVATGRIRRWTNSAGNTRQGLTNVS